MTRAITAVVSKYQRTRIHTSHFVRGEKFALGVDLNGVLATGATISTIIWRVSAPQSVILGTATKGTRTASILCTAGVGAGSIIKVQATASDGAVINQVYAVNVQTGPWFDETAPAAGATSVSA